MAEKGDPRVTRHLVIYLRTEADMTQEAFGKAARIDQGAISDYELGKDAPPEKALRRMAEVADVTWSVVVHMRRFYTAAVAAVDRWREALGEDAEARESALVIESVLLAVIPYLVKTMQEEPERKTLEEEQLEAEQVWEGLERFPIARRRRLLEMGPPAARTFALAQRVRQASLDAAARNAENAQELAELAELVRLMAEEEQKERRAVS